MRDESDLTPLEVLRSVFGYPTFRPHQQQIVEVALAGRDVLAVMPTSAGKSVCYQVPALDYSSDALGRDSRQRRLLLDFVAVAVEPALPPVSAVIQCSPAPVPVLRDGMPVHAVPPGNLREVRPDAALPVRIQFSHEIPLQGPTPLRRRFRAEPSW